MTRQHRLKKRAAFNYVYRKGERASAGCLLLVYAKSREGLKIGISVSKKVGNAVIRNRVKRLIREGVTPLIPRIDNRFMYVLTARESAADADYKTICSAVERAFEKAGKLC